MRCLDPPWQNSQRTKSPLLPQALPGHEAALQAGPLRQEARRLQGAPHLATRHDTWDMWDTSKGKMWKNWKDMERYLQHTSGVEENSMKYFDVCCLFETCDYFLEIISVIVS